MTTYSFELWTSLGSKLADISDLVQDRRFTLQRNEAEQLSFTLDLYEWEAFCASINANPRSLLMPYQTDVKVKRNGQYLFGTQVVALTYQLAGNTSSSRPTVQGASSFNPTMTVTCTGYLNLFKDRYSTGIYTGVETTTIASDLILDTQAQLNGSVGVTISPTPYLTGVTRDRTYSRDNIKSAIQNLTNLVDGRFDFDFKLAADGTGRVFSTYSQIGALRTDLTLVLGGPGSNLTGFYLESSAANLYNRVYGIGSGFGADQLVSIQDDLTSQASNYLREDIRQYNSVVEQSTLDQNTARDLMFEKDLLEIPQMTISGDQLRAGAFISAGDRFPLRVDDHPMLASLNGTYRAERVAVTLDDQDFETITLYFDDLGVTS